MTGINMAKKVSKKSKKKIEIQIPHSWRLCPYGEHWVITHPLTVPPSKKNPSGSVTTRHAHCAHNPSGKDQLYPDEIHEITSQNFSKVQNRPCPLAMKFKDGNKYDDLIAGWTQYWNDVIKPQSPLDPNLIKALIASESGFHAKKLADQKRPNSARGLMQITNSARRILNDEGGEILDHYITATRTELDDPSINICAGIRWLFQKKAIVAKKLKREATWQEVICEYKGLTRANKDRAAELMKRFSELYEDYSKCGK